MGDESGLAMDEKKINQIQSRGGSEVRQKQGRMYLPIRKDTNAFRLASKWYKNTPPIKETIKG